MMIPILHLENHFLIVNKPSGLFTQAAPGVPSLDKLLREQLRQREQSAGTPFIGLPHRLDRETSGVMLIARNQRALKRFGLQFQSRKIGKYYVAVVSGMLDERHSAKNDGTQHHDSCGAAEEQHSSATLVLSSNCHSTAAVTHSTPSPATATAMNTISGLGAVYLWRDWIRKVPEEAKAEVVQSGIDGGRMAELKVTSIATDGRRSLLLFQLLTGRMHQIRLQAAARGLPICGDEKYGSQERFAELRNDSDHALVEHHPIALHALRIEFRHPQTGMLHCATAETPGYWSELPRSILDALDSLTQQSLRDNKPAWELASEPLGEKPANSSVKAFPDHAGTGVHTHTGRSASRSTDQDPDSGSR